MLSFEIPNMSCGHCVRTITEAVQAADPAAQVHADLERHRVDVETHVERALVAQRLTQAGYPPT